MGCVLYHEGALDVSRWQQNHKPQNRNLYKTRKKLSYILNIPVKLN